jgi:hypothetical protein
MDRAIVRRLSLSRGADQFKNCSQFQAPAMHQSITRLPDYPITQFSNAMIQPMSLDERDFFNNRNETRIDKLTCPRCKRVNEYQMRWVIRTRKDRIPPGADERDRALFAKLKDYMIRVDDSVTCKTCGKKFDIPSQHSLVFLQSS